MSHLIQTNFAGGQVSERISPRVDIDKYFNSCRTLQNMQVFPQGCAMKRPGTHYVESTKDDGVARLAPFEFNVEQSYMLMFGDAYMRIFKDGEQVEYIIADVTEWDARTAYSVNDVRKDSDVIYRCIEDVAINYIEDTDTGSEFCSSYSGWPPSYAFDPDIQGWIAGESNPGVTGVSYIGWDYGSGETRTLHSVYLKQDGANYVTSVKLQKSDNGSDWSDVETLTVAAGEQTLSLTGDVTSRAFRLLANSASASTTWVISYMIFNVIGDNIAPASDTDHWIADPNLEITTPYAVADVFDIQHVQSADVMYLVHPDYAPRKLSRTSHTVWTIEEIEFSNGPFRDENTTATTITPSAAGAIGASVNLVASTDIFESTHVGSLWKICHNRGEQSASADIAATSHASSNIKVYGAWTFTTSDTWTGTVKIQKSLDGGTTWLDVKTSTSENVNWTGNEADDDVLYKIISTGVWTGTCTYNFSVEGFKQWGVVRLTAVTDAQHAAGTVERTIESTSATDMWSEGAWSGYRGYPSCITFHQNRLWFGGVPDDPLMLYGSVSDDYENFNHSNTDDDMAIVRRLGAGEMNAIKWLESKTALVAGGGDAEWTIPSPDGNILTPTNFDPHRQSSIGSTNLPAILVAGYLLFLQRGGETTRQFTYNLETDAYNAPSLNLLADDILDGGVVQWALQKDPFPVLYCVRSDGHLIGLTYVPDQKIFAWYDYLTDGEVESVATIADETWLIVKRTINEETKRYVEWFEIWDETLANSWFVDSGVTVTPVAKVCSGLDHLEGETVYVFTGAGCEKTHAVSSGSITLTDTPEGDVVIGLPYTPILQPMELEVPSQGHATSHGLYRKINDVTIRFYKSINAKVGTDASNTQDVSFDEIDLYTGDKRTEHVGGTTREPKIYITQDDPYPLGVLYIIPNADLTER